MPLKDHSLVHLISEPWYCICWVGIMMPKSQKDSEGAFMKYTHKRKQLGTRRKNKGHMGTKAGLRGKKAESTPAGFEPARANTMPEDIVMIAGHRLNHSAKVSFVYGWTYWVNLHDTLLRKWPLLRCWSTCLRPPMRTGQTSFANELQRECLDSSNLNHSPAYRLDISQPNSSGVQGFERGIRYGEETQQH
ncbi:hypothetical protein LI328DRAFT_160961 [Trichoderma asperelloides]|nr:hypothetical protein LI328DRAFT_160961 [Trichoderma asperelloides]